MWPEDIRKLVGLELPDEIYWTKVWSVPARMSVIDDDSYYGGRCGNVVFNHMKELKEMAALPKETCCKICPHYLEVEDYSRKYPERYCTHKGGDRKRRIGTKVPRRSRPDWCPIFRNPPTLRIYALTEMGEFMQHMDELHDGKTHRPSPPMSHRYYLRLETKPLGTARKLCIEIQNLQKDQYADIRDVADRLGTEVVWHEVLEFDDGIQQIFLYLYRDSRYKLNLQKIRFDKAQVQPTQSGKWIK